MSAMKAGFYIAECSLSSAKRNKITFFKKLIGVTTCDIVGTLYWFTKRYTLNRKLKNYETKNA